MNDIAPSYNKLGLAGTRRKVRAAQVQAQSNLLASQKASLEALCAMHQEQLEALLATQTRELSDTVIMLDVAYSNAEELLRKIAANKQAANERVHIIRSTEKVLTVVANSYKQANKTGSKLPTHVSIHLSLRGKEELAKEHMARAMKPVLREGLATEYIITHVNSGQFFPGEYRVDVTLPSF